MSNFALRMSCNNDWVCWVIFHLFRTLHSKLLPSFLQSFSKCSFQLPYQFGCRFQIIIFFKIMFSSSKLPNFRLYFFIVIHKVIGICINSKFCEKRSNRDLRAGPNSTARTLPLWTIAFLGAIVWYSFIDPQFI